MSFQNSRSENNPTPRRQANKGLSLGKANDVRQEIKNQALSNINERALSNYAREFAYGEKRFTRSNVKRPTLADLHLLNELRRPIENLDREQLQQVIVEEEANGIVFYDDTADQLVQETIESNDISVSDASSADSLESNSADDAELETDSAHTDEEQLTVGPVLAAEEIVTDRVPAAPFHSQVSTEPKEELVESLELQQDEELSQIVHNVVESLHQEFEQRIAMRRKKSMAFEFQRPMFLPDQTGQAAAQDLPARIVDERRISTLAPEEANPLPELSSMFRSRDTKKTELLQLPAEGIVRTSKGTIEMVVQKTGRILTPHYNVIGILKSITTSDGLSFVMAPDQKTWRLLDKAGKRVNKKPIKSVTFDRKGNLTYVTTDGSRTVFHIDGTTSAA